MKPTFSFIKRILALLACTGVLAFASARVVAAEEHSKAEPTAAAAAQHMAAFGRHQPGAGRCDDDAVQVPLAGLAVDQRVRLPAPATVGGDQRGAEATDGQAVAVGAHAHGHHLDDCFAYSDSYSDVPMLSVVGHPSAVNPDTALTRLAHAHNWPILHLDRTP